MKFRITKSQFDILKPYFDGDKEKAPGFMEIELEPVIDTVSQALYEQELRNKFYHIGYDTGYQDGWHDRKKVEDHNYCHCGCNGYRCCKKIADPFYYRSHPY